MAIATKGRPTLYKGIPMRSRLEADYASRLDRGKWKWEYEPTVFAGPEGQWLPDFGLTHPEVDDVAPVYVELKPRSHLEGEAQEGYWDRIQRIDELLLRMGMAWLSRPDALLNLIWWEYGKGEIAHVCGIPIPGQRPSWKAQGRFPFATLWPGMGQYA